MLDLTLTEFKLLASLMRSPKRVFSRAELLTHCLPEGIPRSARWTATSASCARSSRHRASRGARQCLGRRLSLRERCVKSAPGLRRQIIHSLGLMALGIISLR